MMKKIGVLLIILGVSNPLYADLNTKKIIEYLESLK